MGELHLHVNLLLHLLTNADHQNSLFKTVQYSEHDFLREIETSQPRSVARS